MKFVVGILVALLVGGELDTILHSKLLGVSQGHDDVGEIGRDDRDDPDSAKACLEPEDDMVLERFGHRFHSAICVKNKGDMIVAKVVGDFIIEYFQEGKTSTCLKIYETVQIELGVVGEEAKLEVDLEPDFDEDGLYEWNSQGYGITRTFTSDAVVTSFQVYEDELEVSSWPFLLFDYGDGYIDTSNATGQIEYGLSAINLVAVRVVIYMLWNMLVGHAI